MKQIEDNYKEIEEIVVTVAKENKLKNILVNTLVRFAHFHGLN